MAARALALEVKGGGDDVLPRLGGGTRRWIGWDGGRWTALSAGWVEQAAAFVSRALSRSVQDRINPTPANKKKAFFGGDLQPRPEP